MSSKKTAVLNILKKQGRRLTPVLDELVQIFLRNKSPLTSVDILRQLQKVTQNVNKTTVYRQLELLRQSGIIQEVQFADRKGRYELLFGNHGHHHHLICLNCAKATDIDLKENIAEQQKIIWKNKKFKVARHSLEFFGICWECQKISVNKFKK